MIVKQIVNLLFLMLIISSCSNKEENTTATILNKKEVLPVNVFMQEQAFNYIALKDTFNYEQMDTIHNYLDNLLVGYIKKNGLNVIEQSTGFARYHSMEKDFFVMEYGKFIYDSIAVKSPFLSSKIDTGYYAFYIHKGSYGNLPDAYSKHENDILSNQLAPKGPAFEIYYKDPSNEPDPSKWETELRTPVYKP